MRVLAARFPRLSLFILSLVVAMGACLQVAPKAFAAACTAPSTDYGTVTESITPPSSGSYYIWTRMAAADHNTGDDTLMIDIDSANCYTIGGASVPTYTTTQDTNGTRFASDSSNWVKISSTVTLSASAHTIKMIGTGTGLVVDTMIFTQNSSCTPTGTGYNCTDSVSPSPVSITSPTAGNVTSPLTVSVSAADDVAVTKVELYVDDVLTLTDTNSPWTFASVSLTTGSHTLKAKAYDAAGNSTLSTGVTVNVPAPPAGTVTITAPTSGAVLSTDLNVAGFNSSAYGAAATVADSNVTKVVFQLDGTTVTTDTSSPYTASLNLTGLACGSHTLQALAQNSAGTTLESDSVTFKTTYATDVNVDGACHVTLSDLSMFALKYGQSGSNLGRADINMSGSVTITDLSMLALNYNKH